MQIQDPFPHTFSIDFNLIKFGDIDEVLPQVRIEITSYCEPWIIAQQLVKL